MLMGDIKETFNFITNKKAENLRWSAQDKTWQYDKMIRFMKKKNFLVLHTQFLAAGFVFEL